MGILKKSGAESSAPSQEEKEALELYELGRRYMDGDGVEKDVEKAVKLYHQALGRWEIPELDYEVGRCYALGIGVEKDNEQAKLFLQRCCGECPGAAELLMKLCSEEGNWQLALYYAGTALLLYPELSAEVKEIVSGAKEGRRSPSECIDILRKYALYEQENSVYHYAVDLMGAISGNGGLNLDYIIGAVLNLYAENPLKLWQEKDQDFWVALAVQFAEGSIELSINKSMIASLAAAGVATLSAYAPDTELPKLRHFRKDTPPKLDRALQAIRGGDFSQSNIDALHQFADGGNYFATEELYFLSTYISSERDTRSLRYEQLREQGCPAYSDDELLMTVAVLRELDPNACRQLALMLSGKRKGNLHLPSEMATKLLAGVYMSAAEQIYARLEKAGDLRAAFELAGLYDETESNGDYISQIVHCVEQKYAPAVMQVMPDHINGIFLYDSSRYDGYYLPDAISALSAVPSNFFDRDFRIKDVKETMKKKRQLAAEMDAARRAQAERMVRSETEEKLDRRERVVNTFLTGASVTNEELFGVGALLGIEGSAEGYALSNYNRESAINSAVRKKEQELADEADRQRWDRAADRLTVTGRIYATCFVGDTDYDVWLADTPIGKARSIIRGLSSFDYFRANEAYLDAKKKVHKDPYSMAYVSRLGHKLALYEEGHYKAAALLWHEASMIRVYRQEPESELGREMLCRLTYLGNREVSLEQAKIWFRQGENQEQTARILKEFADEGRLDAKVLLAVCYLYGSGVPKDARKGLEMMREAAENGSTNAYWQLGFYYDEGAEGDRDAGLAVSWYEKAAVHGHYPAILRLAKAYLNGELGLKKDFDKALLYVVQGVIAGDADCIDFYNGITTEQAGDLIYYYSRKGPWKKEPGFFRLPTPENLAYEKLRDEKAPPGTIKYSKHLVTAAEAGFVDAQHLLGTVYKHGRGVGRDMYSAFCWFIKSAEQGYLPAIEDLTLMLCDRKNFHNLALSAHYYNFAVSKGSKRKDLADALQAMIIETYQRGSDAEQKGDFREACRLFGQSGGLGHSESQYRFAWYIDSSVNIGEVKDDKLAVKIYTQAANQGFPGAMYRLGLCCKEGRGTPRDPEAAEKWFGKAVENGCVNVLRSEALDYYDAKNYVLAADRARGAAELGDSDCMALLGAMYTDGLGNEKDDAKALYWYEKAAEHGRVKSMVQAADCYRKGIGTEIDQNAALRWYECAAQNGDRAGQFYLALCYEKGRGVEKDPTQAVEWYQKASDQGNTTAMSNLGWMYADGNGVPKDEEHAVRLFRQAMDKGSIRGKYSIGRCMVEGIGMEVDKEAGFSLIRKVAAKYAPAQKYLEKHKPDDTESV